ncbi:MAG: methyltransferase domain-containing protein [Chitinivibrionales bacterium]|nr:methyltransferase domain-containing protein [Chitinivibrionales bacterium]MBD3357679.1 methyltransferase domain-containing protein [Chitinivibrionales bacterium]
MKMNLRTPTFGMLNISPVYNQNLHRPGGTSTVFFGESRIIQARLCGTGLHKVKLYRMAIVKNTLLEAYPCPLCGSEDRRLLFVVKGFTLVRCRSCTLVYVNPRIRNEKIYDIYSDHYFKSNESGYDNYELAAHLRVRTFRRWYQEIKPYLLIQGGPALDIGCAAGYFLDILREEGWNAEGIELDPEMRAQVRAKGFSVSDKPIEHFDGDKRYDLITLFDVLEHLPKLKNDARTLAGLLRDKGTIALVTPDFDSLQRKLLGKRWFQLKPTEHIHYFTRGTLRRLAEESGLKVVHTVSSGQYADLSFLHNRLVRYGFPHLAAAFKSLIKAAGLSKMMWYADTGSMLALLQKKN